MKKTLIPVISALFHVSVFSAVFPAFGAPLPDAYRLEESLARELSGAAVRGICFLASLQKENGSFSDDPGSDRRIATLIGSFAQDEPELKKVLEKHRPPAKTEPAEKKEKTDAKSEPYRELSELVQALRKTEGSVLFPEHFRSWRNDMAKRLLETQNAEGGWGNARGTFHALCTIRMIF